jgi:uncharacterized protein YqfA (UPF0365 family)
MFGLSEILMQAGHFRVFVTALLIICGIVLLLFLLLFVKFSRLWAQAFFARAEVKIPELIGMLLRKTDPKVIVINRIMAVQAGLNLTTKELESHYIAGVNIPKVVRALIVGKRNGIDLSLEEAAKRDLAGRDVLAEVQSSVRKEGPVTGPQPERLQSTKQSDGLTDVLGHEKSI